MDQVQMAVREAQVAAAQATGEFLQKHGDRDACGFAWVTVYEKGSTKMGRALLKAGFRKAYGGGLQMWNPSGLGVQSISVLEAGADAMAKFLTEHLGVTAYANSRMD